MKILLVRFHTWDCADLVIIGHSNQASPRGTDHLSLGRSAVRNERASIRTKGFPGCLPVSERTSEIGYWILASEFLGQPSPHPVSGIWTNSLLLPKSSKNRVKPLFKRLEKYGC
jgi:hypothetical protein